MSSTPTTKVTSISREAWIDRAKTQQDFCDLTHDEQDQLAAAFGQEIDPKLDTIGRVFWATNFERRLSEGWAIPQRQKPS